MELLNRAELVFIFIEVFILIWAMWLQFKSTKENRPQQYLSMKLLVISCGIITMLYVIDVILFKDMLNLVLIGLWGMCTWVWWKYLVKNLPKKHEAEDNLKEAEDKLKEAEDRLFETLKN